MFMKKKQVIEFIEVIGGLKVKLSDCMLFSTRHLLWRPNGYFQDNVTGPKESKRFSNLL